MDDAAYKQGRLRYGNARDTRDIDPNDLPDYREPEYEYEVWVWPGDTKGTFKAESEARAFLAKLKRDPDWVAGDVKKDVVGYRSRRDGKLYKTRI